MTDGTTTWTYEYNADGLRTSRSDGTTTYEYIYNGGSLVQMTVGDNTLYFANGAVVFNGAPYYYVTNLQGDVISILNHTGAVVVEYTYDAWGRILSMSDTSGVNLGTLNPLRYRGYVYDSESGLYYLQSRYYNPEMGRFINADVLVSTGQGLLGNNMFAYCRNNPVCRVDIPGTADQDCVGADEDALDDEELTGQNGGLAPSQSVGTQGGQSAESFSGSSSGSTTNGVLQQSGGSTSKGLSFASESELHSHYAKHNPSFGNVFDSPQEYLDSANYVIENGQYHEGAHGYYLFYGRNGHANYAFVGLSRDFNFITTYHIKPASQIFYQ